MIISLVTFGISMALGGDGYWLTPLAEWVTTLLYVNFFAVLSMTNMFFDTVHEENIQLSKSNGA